MAEVAGLIVGIVPLISCTVKQYGSVRKMCKRFRNFKNELIEVMKDLKIQQTIFKNETRLLLKAVFKEDDVEQMMVDADNKLWFDTETESQLQQLLGDSQVAFEEAVQKVSSQLLQLEKEVAKFSCNDGSEFGSTGHQKRKELRKRFSFASAGDKLERMSDAIAKATTNYRVLRSQLQQLESSNRPPDNQRTRTERRTALILATQEAARQVYHALLTSCSKHDYHVAHFSLHPICTPSKTSFEVVFQVSYRHILQVKKHDDILWFQVQSSVAGGHQLEQSETFAITSTGDTAYSCKRTRTLSISSNDIGHTSRSKRVRFRSPSPSPSPSPSIISSQASIHAAQKLPGMSKTNVSDLTDFCTKLRAYHINRDQLGRCIGTLKSGSGCEHRVFPSTGPHGQAAIRHDNASTLAGLLSAASSKPSKRGSPLSFVQRLRLAKLFAQAVLNYHATPWMKKTWRSKDIILYSSTLSPNDQSTSRDLQPFVEVSVCDSSKITDQQHSKDSLEPFVRNLELFDLGIILLELAYEMPLSDMLEANDCKENMPSAAIDFFAAVRLSKEVATCMGNKYAKIVEQCLSCSFGQGVDLTSTDLQDTIHQEVIVELERLAIGFENLGLN